MEWLLAVALFAALVLAFFNVNLFGRRWPRNDLSHAVKSMLVLLEDGAWLSIKVRGSPVALRVIRENEMGSAATANLQVPRAPWSLGAGEKLRQLCDAHGYEGCFGTESVSDPLCEIRLSVKDIWSPSAGAPGARLTNLVLDALGVEQHARLKIDLVGKRSRRLVDRERALRRGEDK
jgi:hypothetical protein